MKYIKLNRNWNAELNSPDPEISLIDEGIELSFALNHDAFEHIDEGEKGKVVFDQVYAYRLDSTDRDGYLNRAFRFKNDQLPWGEFYELRSTKWKDFPEDKTVLDQEINKDNLRHFIFFFGNQIFECLAADYRFYFNNGLAELLEKKYPKGYLNHYLSMFASQFDKPSGENFKVYTDLYIQMEGKKEFSDLKNELQKIKKGSDLGLYLKFANSLEIIGFGKKQLDEMVMVIEKFKS
jgi:hypothetical protein